MEIGYFIWKLSAMPANPMDLVAFCKQYGIKRLAIKVLNHRYKFNVPYGDKPLIEYFNVLRANGIIVEGWGYHYPDQTGAQGDAIEERRDKLGLKTYHLDVEGEWKEVFGMPKEAEAIMNKLKVNGFEVLLCSYRYPSMHSQVPFNKFMNHSAMDGAAPQVYWAGKHNPVEQLNACLVEYSAWGKPVYPVGSTFGATFEVKKPDGGTEKFYWEATPADASAFRQGAEREGIPRIYYWSLDWILSKKRFDLLEAATGVNTGGLPPVIPPPEKDILHVTNCSWVNGRSEATAKVDNRVLVLRGPFDGKPGQPVINNKVQNGNWFSVNLGPIDCWIDGDYLE